MLFVGLGDDEDSASEVLSGPFTATRSILMDIPNVEGLSCAISSGFRDIDARLDVQADREAVNGIKLWDSDDLETK